MRRRSVSTATYVVVFLGIVGSSSAEDATSALASNYATGARAQRVVQQQRTRAEATSGYGAHQHRTPLLSEYPSPGTSFNTETAHAVTATPGGAAAIESAQYATPCVHSMERTPDSNCGPGARVQRVVPLVQTARYQRPVYRPIIMKAPAKRGGYGGGVGYMDSAAYAPDARTKDSITGDKFETITRPQAGAGGGAPIARNRLKNKAFYESYTAGAGYSGSTGINDYKMGVRGGKIRAGALGYKKNNFDDDTYNGDTDDDYNYNQRDDDDDNPYDDDPAGSTMSGPRLGDKNFKKYFESKPEIRAQSATAQQNGARTVYSGAAVAMQNVGRPAMVPITMVSVNQQGYQGARVAAAHHYHTRGKRSRAHHVRVSSEPAGYHPPKARRNAYTANAAMHAEQAQYSKMHSQKAVYSLLLSSKKEQSKSTTPASHSTADKMVFGVAAGAAGLALLAGIAMVARRFTYVDTDAVLPSVSTAGAIAL